MCTVQLIFLKVYKAKITEGVNTDPAVHFKDPGYTCPSTDLSYKDRPFYRTALVKHGCVHQKILLEECI